ncbi:hypothetical protein F8388_008407 [Cannabis sativa]|uniref:Piwi domain-containing protein n=1 Tax=Cannabis sativa TaxID=3483 RepID=A0A7J6E3V7_CANSA|nr:hypothetical protein F8388_008407 [Cannabis sativa]
MPYQPYQNGTVVDTKICHRTEFDFYLCSHAGIQESSKLPNSLALLREYGNPVRPHEDNANEKRDFKFKGRPPIESDEETHEDKTVVELLQTSRSWPVKLLNERSSSISFGRLRDDHGI